VILYLGLCATGGWLLVRTGFTLAKGDRLLVGGALGLALSTRVANWLGHISIRRWHSGWRRSRCWRRAPWLAKRPAEPAGGGQAFALLVAVVLGLRILFFPDGPRPGDLRRPKELVAHLLMAAGEIHSHFYMNPGLFAYHYGFQLSVRW
jgi:hypothetical protein